MKKHLFLHLGIVGLMGLSTIVYGGSTPSYTKYVTGDGKIPNGDCLEMMCQYGCVEDENGLNGTCCPNDGTNGSACTIGACCKSGSCINGKCDCPADKPIWNGAQCCFDVGCGCNVAKVNGCCPGVVDLGCGCGIAKTAEGCCPGVVKGCDGVCGSGKTDIGCGCGVSITAEGCCPGVVKGCDGVCGSGKTDVGCGCGVSITEEGCCEGQVKDCLGVCGGKAVETIKPGTGGKKTMCCPENQQYNSGSALGHTLCCTNGLRSKNARNGIRTCCYGATEELYWDGTTQTGGGHPQCCRESALVNGLCPRPGGLVPQPCTFCGG